MLATCLLLFAASTLQEPGDLVRTGDHFQVTSEIAIEAHVDRALEIAEEAWTVTTRCLSARERETDRLISLRLLRLRGSLAGDLHYSPKLPEKRLRTVDLPMRTAGPVAYRAAELTIKRIVPAADSLPLWLSEGLAAYVEEQSLFELGHSERPNEEPRFANRRVLCQRLSRAAKRPDLGQFLADDIQSLLPAEQRALRALFFRELVGDEDRFKTFAKAMLQIGGGADYARALHAMLRNVYGAELWSGFWNHVAELRPQWEVTNGGLATHDSGFVQHAQRLQSSLAWKVGEPLTAEWTLEGVVEIGNRQSSVSILLGAPNAAERLTNSIPTHLAVCIAQGNELTVSRYDATQASYRELGKVNINAPSGTPYGFLIESSKTGITVTVADSRPLELKLDRPATGAWGLQSSKGSLTLWNSIAIR